MFVPVQLTTSRLGNLTRSIYTMCGHTSIHRRKTSGSRATGTLNIQLRHTMFTKNVRLCTVHHSCQPLLARSFARPRSIIFSGCRLEEKQAAGFSRDDGRDDNDHRNGNDFSDCRVEGDNGDGNQSMESSVRSSPNMARDVFTKRGEDKIDVIASVLLVSSVRCYLSRLGANLTSHVDRKTRRLNPWIGCCDHPLSYLFEQTYPSPYCHRDHPLC